MRKILITLLLCMSVMAVLPQAAFAYDAPTVTITLSEESIEVGKPVKAEFSISNSENYEYGWYFWTLKTDDDEWQCPDEGGSGDLEGLNGTISFVPKFGQALKLQITLNHTNGDDGVFFSDKIPVIGDQSKPPIMDIQLQKTSVTIGDEATVTYAIDGYGEYVETRYECEINTSEEGWAWQTPEDSYGSSEKLIDSISYSPRYGKEMRWRFWVKDKNGREYEFVSPSVSIIGDQSIKPIVAITLDKDKAAIGELVTATYKIENVSEGSRIEYAFFNRKDNSSATAPVGDYGTISNLEGKVSCSPKFGCAYYFHITIVDKNGRKYYYKTEEIPIVGIAADYEKYTVIEGQNVQISTGENSLTFRADGEFEKYLGVQVDGKTVPGEHVKAWSGSTYVELSAEYLASLPEGDHELIIVFEDGVAVTNFATAKKLPELPQTGDSSNIALYMMLTALSVVALAVMARKRRTE